MAVLVGKVAPDFTASAAMPDHTICDKFNLMTYLKGKKGILFFYPLDFTFVCPSEILAFDHRKAEFDKRNTALIGVSVDSHYTHLAWRRTPIHEGGIGAISFPLVADLTKSIAKDYDVLTGDAIALRGTFLIDEQGIVRHQVVNDLPLGRNVDEALRMVDALAFHQAHGEVCPAGWTVGKPGMSPSSEGAAAYLKSHGDQL